MNEKSNPGVEVPRMKRLANGRALHLLEFRPIGAIHLVAIFFLASSMVRFLLPIRAVAEDRPNVVSITEAVERNPSPVPTPTPVVEVETPPVVSRAVSSPAPKPEVEKKSSKNRPSKVKPKRRSRPANRGIYIRAKKAFLAGKLKQAQGLLEGIVRRDGKEIRGLAAEVHFASCKLAFEMQDWTEASRRCGLAVKLNRHAGARKRLKKLSKRAERLYLEGYVMEGTDPCAAAVRYREAEQIAPRGNKYGHRAEEKLKLLLRVTSDCSGFSDLR